MKIFQFLATLAASAVVASSASAVTVIYNVTLTGANEITGGAASGDLNGSAIGTLTLNTDTNNISWSLTLVNIDPPTGAKVTDFHIHTGNFNQQGGVLIGLGVPGGSLVGTSFAGNINVAGGDITDMATVIANPSGFYLNIHNQEFPGGAVRGQIPEPAPAVLALVGGIGCFIRRRR